MESNLQIFVLIHNVICITSGIVVIFNDDAVRTNSPSVEWEMLIIIKDLGDSLYQ